MSAAAPLYQIERVPPHNYEAEQAVLGALLIKNALYDDMAEFLRAEHFADPGHALIYEAVGKAIAVGRKVDPVTLQRVAADTAEIANLGGVRYLTSLVGAVATMTNAVDYARVVFDTFQRRELIGVLSDALDRAHQWDGQTTAPDIMEAVEGQIASITQDAIPQDSIAHASAWMNRTLAQIDAAMKAGGRPVGITSGLTDLDHKLGGLRAGALIILAGRPSMGKSAMGRNMALAAAKSGVPAFFWSGEMPGEELAARDLAGEAEYPLHMLRDGRLDQFQLERVLDAKARLDALPVYTDDTPAITVAGLRTRCRRMKRKHGLGLVVVDYLQLLRGTGSRQSEANRVLEVSEITRSLKALAKELKVPVVALSQLSRAVEQREDKRPQLSDLRESGSIEQDADAVVFVYREEYYLSRAIPKEGTKKHAEWQEDMMRCAGTAEAIVAKNRNGPVGTVRLAFNGEHTKFRDLYQGGAP